VFNLHCTPVGHLRDVRFPPISRQIAMANSNEPTEDYSRLAPNFHLGTRGESPHVLVLGRVIAEIASQPSYLYQPLLFTHLLSLCLSTDSSLLLCFTTFSLTLYAFPLFQSVREPVTLLIIRTFSCSRSASVNLRI
jgi:hypothetical protein